MYLRHTWWTAPYLKKSVAGPFMFTVYAAPLEDLVRSYGVETMIYADDTQLYLVLDSCSDGKLQRLEDCARGVKAWTAENRLLLNDSKTEVLHLTSRFIRNPTPISTIKGGDCDVDIASEVRTLVSYLISTWLSYHKWTKCVARLAWLSPKLAVYESILTVLQQSVWYMHSWHPDLMPTIVCF